MPPKLDPLVLKHVWSQFATSPVSGSSTVSIHDDSLADPKKIVRKPLKKLSKQRPQASRYRLGCYRLYESHKLGVSLLPYARSLDVELTGQMRQCFNDLLKLKSADITPFKFILLKSRIQSRIDNYLEEILERISILLSNTEQGRLVTNTAAYRATVENLVEFIKNSIDANATKLTFSFYLDPVYNQVTVKLLDNGYGIPCANSVSGFLYGVKTYDPMVIISQQSCKREKRDMLGGANKGLLLSALLLNKFNGNLSMQNVFGIARRCVRSRNFTRIPCGAIITLKSDTSSCPRGSIGSIKQDLTASTLYYGDYYREPPNTPITLNAPRLSH